MKLIIVAVLLLSTTAIAQHEFNLQNPSKTLSVKVVVEKCDGGWCSGRAEFSFFRKGASKPFQIVNLPNTNVWPDRKGQPQINATLRYDEQSVLNFDDFNFDGLEDVAICDGTNGGYGMPSYRVYLYSNQGKRFVHSPTFTALGQGPSLGMFETDKDKKMHFRFSKSGCCWHQTEGFAVIKGHPKKVYELTEDATQTNSDNIEITTKKLIRGKWRTWTRKVKRTDGN